MTEEPPICRLESLLVGRGLLYLSTQLFALGFAEQAFGKLVPTEVQTVPSLASTPSINDESPCYGVRAPGGFCRWPSLSYLETVGLTSNPA